MHTDRFLNHPLLESPKWPSRADIPSAKLASGATHLFMVFVFFLSAIYGLVAWSYDGHGGFLLRIFNIVGPVSLMVGAFFVFYTTVKRYPVLLWTPFFFYLGNIAIFSGFGSLVHAFGNEASINYLQGGPFSLSELELLRTNLLNSVSIGFIVFGFLVTTRVLRSKLNGPLPLITYTNVIEVKYIAIGFIIFGAMLRYGIILPSKFGMHGFVLPGAINSLQFIFDLGIALLAFLAVKEGGVWRKLLIILLPLHLASILIEFFKTPMILAMLLPAIGAFLAHGNMKKLALWGVIIIATFASLQPLVNFGRAEIIHRSGNIYEAPLAERISIVQRFFSGERLLASEGREDEQAAWIRIAYNGPQAYAMRERDAGYTFDTWTNIWIVFIPRIIWTNKPEGFGPGRSFYEMVTGRDSARVGITVYADAYWNAGWGGVILIGILLGALYGYMSFWVLNCIKSMQFIFLPGIMIAIEMAMMGPNGWVINSILGPLPILFAYIVGIRIFTRIIIPLRRRYGAQNYHK